MKALTIKEPWASLIINGYKEYEFRSWKTNYRGKILIHSGLSKENSRKDLFKKYDLGYKYGYIIGEAYIEDCILVDETFNNNLKSINQDVYRDNYLNYYAWELTNIKKYKEPIPCKGRLSLWEYEK